MIYLNNDLVGSRNYFINWLEKNYGSYFETEIMDHMIDLFDTLFAQSLKFLDANCKLYQQMSNITHTQAFTKYLTIILKEAKFSEGNVVEENIIEVKKKLNVIFTQAIAWSLGMTVMEEYRKSFDKFLRRIVADSVKSEVKEDRIIKFHKGITPPEYQGSWMVDYWLDMSNYEFINSKDKLNEIDSKDLQTEFKKFHDIYIETYESLRIRKMINLTQKYSVPVLLIGPTGIGKTQLINSELMKYKVEQMLILKANFAARTTSASLQNIVESKIERKMKNLYRPPLIGQKGLIFIDDLNLPAPDMYGFQPPLELLRQFLEYKGWYNMEEVKMINIADFSVIGVIAPPGGSRSAVPSRLLRHFFIYSSIENNDLTLSRIFSKVSDWICLTKQLSDDSKRIMGFVVDSSITIFQSLTESLKATPAKPHYMFNLRDLSKILQGMNLVHHKEFDKGTNNIARAWVHETYRVMGDRLIMENDKKWFYSKVKHTLDNKLRAKFENIMQDI